MACIKEKIGHDTGEIFMTGKGVDSERFQKEVIDDSQSNYFIVLLLEKKFVSQSIYLKYQKKDCWNQPAFINTTMILGASVLNC